MGRTSTRNKCIYGAPFRYKCKHLSMHVLNIVPKIKALDLIPTQHKLPNTKLKTRILLHEKAYVDKLCLVNVICINGNVIFIRSSNTTNEQHTWILNNIPKDSTDFDILCLISKTDQILSTSIKCDNTTRRAFGNFDTESHSPSPDNKGVRTLRGTNMCHSCSSKLPALGEVKRFLGTTLGAIATLSRHGQIYLISSLIVHFERCLPDSFCWS